MALRRCHNRNGDTVYAIDYHDDWAFSWYLPDIGVEGEIGKIPLADLKSTTGGSKDFTESLSTKEYPHVTFENYSSIHTPKSRQS